MACNIRGAIVEAPSGVARSMTGWTFINGTTRAVLCIGGLAIKFARSADGARGNRFEADMYRRSDPERRKLLCTPLWCSPNGAVLMMRRARPMTEGDFRQHVRHDH
jgi:hypothetical protein